MRIVKNILLLFIFCALGALLGSSVFYVQKQLIDRTTGAAPTPTPTAAAHASVASSSTSTFTDGDTHVTFSLPSNGLVQINNLTGYNATTARSLSIFTQSGNTITDTGLAAYLLSKDGVTTFTVDKARALREAIGLYAQSTSSLTTNKGTTVTVKNYVTSSGGTETSYEVNYDTVYVLVVATPGLSLTQSQVETFVKSINLDTTAPASSTPTTANSPLLQPSL